MVCGHVQRDNPRIIDRTGAQTMLYLNCTMISSVDLAQYVVSCVKDWVPVDFGTNMFKPNSVGTDQYGLGMHCLEFLQ